MKKLLIILLLFPSLCFAGNWTKEDTYRQATYMTLHVIDWGQSRDIAKNPQIYRETNPLLGRHPSVSRVDAVLASTLLLHTYIAYKLPPSHRKTWQMFWVGVEFGATLNNYRAGVEINF